MFGTASIVQPLEEKYADSLPPKGIFEDEVLKGFDMLNHNILDSITLMYVAWYISLPRTDRLQSTLDIAIQAYEEIIAIQDYEVADHCDLAHPILRVAEPKGRIPNMLKQ